MVPPPPGDDLPRLSDCVDFHVEFPVDELDRLEIPPAQLVDVFEAARRSLHRAAGLLAEIGTQHWRTASFVPSDDAGERYLSDASKYLHWIWNLFERLASEYPDVAREELRRWPLDEPYFFAKLSIQASSLAVVADGCAFHAS